MGSLPSALHPSALRALLSTEATQRYRVNASPVELRAPEGAVRMEIDWDDGLSTAYRHEILRGFCPCATCQGHHGPVRWVEPPQSASLVLGSLEQVGNYALRLSWGDGHATGIYTFQFLRELASHGEAAADDVRELRFMR